MRLLALIVLAGSTALAQVPMMYYQAAPAVGGGGGARTAVVQRGFVSMTATDDSVDVDVTAFDTTHTWVTIQIASDSLDMEDYLCTVDIVDGNTIRVKRGDDNGGNLQISYSVISDPGLTVSRYRGTILDADDSVAVTISSVTTSKTWLYTTFWMNLDATWDYRYSVSQELESSTTVKLRRMEGFNNISYVLQVVSYDSCTVQRGFMTSVGTAATKDVPITALTDSSKAFATLSLHSTLAGGGSMNDWGWYATWYSNDATIDTMRLVRFDTYSSYRLYWEVVEFTDGSTVKPIHFNSVTANTHTATVTAADTAYSGFLGTGPHAMHSAINNGTSSRPRSMWTYQFNDSTTQVYMTRYGDTLESKGKAYILEWKGVN